MNPVDDVVNDAEITAEELDTALRKLKQNKTGADDGLVAEMLKTGHRKLLEVIVNFFAHILQRKQPPPEQWKLTKARVVFQKGEPELPKNYRPIAILPVMAKLFSTVLYLRIAEHIDERLSEEQYGFRTGRGCADALRTMRVVVVEKSLEWGEQLWR